MTDCVACGDEADVTVIFEDPDERLPYCDDCGPAKAFSNPSATGYEEGTDNLEEVENAQ